MIPVIWYDGCRGNWDHGTLMHIFEKHPAVFPQWNSKERWLNLQNRKQAIVIVSGCPDAETLNLYLRDLKKGIVILTSEEDAYFDWKAAIPDHLDLWTQYYSPSTKSEIKTRLLIGAPSRLKDYKINKHLPKKYLWSFVGQVQNPFRQQCVEELEFWDKGGHSTLLRKVEFFGGHGKNGTDYQEYLDIMCQSKYIICPAGSMCVDSFRVYEAIRCGAIPITDVRAPRDAADFNYWNEVYPSHGLVTVESWKDLAATIFDLENKHVRADPKGYWYEQYEKDLENKLLKYANS